MRILIIEDDATTAAYIAKGLGEDGHVTQQVSAGRDGLFNALSEAYDAIILDRMLPNMDGLAVVRSLRASGDTTPVLMLTALEMSIIGWRACGLARMTISSNLSRTLN